jgi:hypothetical protein
MNDFLKISAISLMFLAKTGAADPYNIPIQLDYGLIKKAVVSQLFTGEGGAAEVWNDKHKCSFLKLFNPRISGENGQIKLLNDVQAQFGKAFGGQCMPFIAWDGALSAQTNPYSVCPSRKRMRLTNKAANWKLDNCKTLFEKSPNPSWRKLRLI